MSYTPKQQGNSGNSSGGGGPSQTNNQQQTAKVLAGIAGIAGIQQQMQNLVHGQNAAGQGSTAANLNALMALRQQQQQHNQHFESIIKQQQLYLSNPQLVQQFQQQIQQQQQHQNIGGGGGSGSGGGGGGAGSAGGGGSGGSGGKEPLALTRTPAAAELLNKTLQQQANGSTVGGGINSASTVVATAATAQQFQQQLQALAQNPGNIMQTLQAYHHQMAQQQQQQQQQQHQLYQSNRLPPQQQFQSQQQNLTSSAPTVQQQQQNQHHVQQYPQTNYQQQKILSTTSVASKTPGQIKLNLPAATQMTPIPSPSVVPSTVQQQSNNNFTTNKNQTKSMQQQQQAQQPQLPTSTSSRPINTQQQQSSTVSITTTTTGIISGSGNVGSSSLTKSPIPGNRTAISPISSIASSALHLHQKNSLNQQNSMVNIKHQSVSSKLPPPTQITAVPLTKPIVATSSPAKGNLISNIQSPKGSNVQSISAVNQPKSIVAATPAVSATVPNNLGTSSEGAKTNPQQQTQPSKSAAIQNKIPSVNNPATTSTSNVAISAPIISTIISPTSTSLTITPVPAAVVVPAVTTTVVSAAPSINLSTHQQTKKDDVTKEPINNATSQDKNTDSKPNIVIAVENNSKLIEKPNDKNIGKLTKEDKIDKKLSSELKKSELKLSEEKQIVETKNEKIEMNIMQKIPEKKSIEKITETKVSANNISINSPIEKLSTTANITKTSETITTSIQSNITLKDNSGSIISHVNISSEKISDGMKKSNKNERVISVAVKSPKEKSPVKSNTSTSITISSPSTSSSRLNQKKKTSVSSDSTKVDNKKKTNSSTIVTKEPSRLRQTIAKSPSTPTTVTNIDGSIGTAAPATPITSSEKTDGRSKRHRLKTILYQSPLPELAFITKLSASEASNSPKPSQSNEDKLIVFYKNEFLAVRNADGGFFLCQTMQNVYKTSPKIRIRWLSEEKKDTNVYIPDFYDHTDIECVLTTVELSKVNKERLKLPQTEKERIENILKKAIDVEKGILPRPDVTEENPDGLDISLYKNESQIEKKSSSSSKKLSASKSPKRSLPLRSKTPKKKKKLETKSSKISKLDEKNSVDGDDDDDDDDDPENDQYETEEETEEEEYKPSQKKKTVGAQQLVKVRAQRSPLAKARAASPITIKNQQQTSKTLVPPKNSKSDDSKLATSRNDRAKRRATDTSISEEPIPVKKSLITTTQSIIYKRGTLQKTSATSKTTKSEDDEPLISPSNKGSSELNTKSSTSKIIGGDCSNISPSMGKKLSNSSPDKISATSITTTTTTTPTSSNVSGRPTRSRK